ncbi:hypothetical protein ACIBF6_24480 [Streptosporangium amethystogenes]|uniref:hypothetical protein n=1 Tax=Streptosporangium amethystogenes TaxID=2002 RepID=UPI0037BDA532
MKHIRNLVAAAAAVAVTAVVLVPLPASAATATIRRGTSVAPAYSGKILATLIESVSVTTTLGTATCNTGAIGGTVQSNGTGLNVTSFTFSNNPGPLCPNSTGGSSTVSPVGLPWLNGTVIYDTGGGRNGVVTLQNVKVSSVTTGWFGTISCVYKGSGAGNSIALDAYNPGNTNGPAPSLTEARARAVDFVLNKDSGSLLCPGTAKYSASFKLLGETTAGSGVFDQTLFLTTP